MEAEFHLPEAIIQHVQSFMKGKEAAQTTILSKSWHTAWLTRPDLDFVQKDFVRISDDKPESSANRFWEFVKETMQRYEKFSRKIRSLRLCVYGSYECNLCDKLIMKVLELGATCLDIKYYYPNREFALPYQVFESENLIRLSASGCKIRMEAGGKVRCSRLRSLALDRVYVEGNVIWDIISSCLLIENLSLSLSSMQLCQFPELGVGKVGKDIDGKILRHKFRQLKRLFLHGVDFHPLYFHDFSSKFPCLKDLTLDLCYGLKVVQISSPSLERINFTGNELLRVEFDVPNIRKFTLSGPPVPSLSFKTTASTWESHVSITCWHYPRRAEWFLSLNKLLRTLSQSKVYLSLVILSEKTLGHVPNIRGLPKPEVENLMVKGPHLVSPALFYSLFQCCRPIYITQYWFPELFGVGEKNNNFMEFVHERMNCCIAYQSKSGESDLEEVNVECYDDSVSAWRPLLSDASSSTEAVEHRIRLHLRWGC